MVLLVPGLGLKDIKRAKSRATACRAEERLTSMHSYKGTRIVTSEGEAVIFGNLLLPLNF